MKWTNLDNIGTWHNPYNNNNNHISMLPPARVHVRSQGIPVPGPRQAAPGARGDPQVLSPHVDKHKEGGH